MKTCGRSEAIGALRQALESWCDDEHSVCEVAAKRGLFCKGFAQWKFGELKKRYPQITRSRRALTRRELEDLANRWQLARQFATGEDFACDVQSHEQRYQQCMGWDEFSDPELEQFHAEVCGEEVQIEGE